MCQQSLFPPGWCVTWGNERQEFQTERAGRIGLLALSMLLPPNTRLRLMSPAGRCVETVVWREGRLAARCVSTGG